MVLSLCTAGCAANGTAAAAGASNAPVNTSAPFTDVPGDAGYTEAVAWCHAQGLMVGTSATQFSPDATLNRAMVATVLYRAAGEPSVTGDPAFTDTQADQWYSKAVAWAAERGIVNDYTSADLNWTNSSSRVNAEHDDESKRDIQLVKTTPDNWADYTVVFVGYPIWWGIAAWPVNNFVTDNDFSGKTVIPFCTSASSDLGQSGELLAEMAGEGDWQTGCRFSSGASQSTVSDWVKSLALPVTASTGVGEP